MVGSVSDDVLAWARAALDTAPLKTASCLKAGGSCDILQLRSDERASMTGSVIVRRYADREWLDREPYLPANEVRMTRFAHAADLPVPVILGCRMHATPLVAMSALPGSPVATRDIDRELLEKAAEAARAIHAVRPPDPLGDYRSYAPHYFHTSVKPQCPDWSQMPGVWTSAIAIYEAFQPASPKALLHRDFHFGNLLFTGRHLSGIVDWVTACFGDPQADISHMRWNLMMSHGEEAMSTFSKAYYAGQGSAHDPIWDVYALTGALPDLTTLTPCEARRMDAFMARALATLGTPAR